MVILLTHRRPLTFLCRKTNACQLEHCDSRLIFDLILSTVYTDSECQKKTCRSFCRLLIVAWHLHPPITNFDQLKRCIYHNLPSERRSAGYQRPGRNAILPPPKVVRCLIPPLSPPFLLPPPDCRHGRSTSPSPIAKPLNLPRQNLMKKKSIKTVNLVTDNRLGILNFPRPLVDGVRREAKLWQESWAIAKMTARCALHTRAPKIFRDMATFAEIFNRRGHLCCSSPFLFYLTV